MLTLPVFKIKKIDYDALENKLCSIVLCTFRETPKFELLFESLSRQTIKNFELVIADYLFDSRKDYVQSLAKKYGIPTTHVPRDKYGVKAFNVGIANSRGEYMIHINDANYFQNRFIEKHMITMSKGFLSLGTRYFTYNMPFPIEKHLSAWIEVPEVQKEEIKTEINKLSNGIDRYLILHFGEHEVVSPQDFRLLGLPGAILTQDNLMIEANSGWTYGGNIGGPTEIFLAINGFDEEFDKGYGHSDCNLGVRAFNAGYKSLINVSNWSLEIHDEDHQSVFNLLPDYEKKTSADHNWKLYEDACACKTIRANPHMDLRKIREETLNGNNN